LLLAACFLAASCSQNPDVAKRKYFDSGNDYFRQKKFGEAVVQYGNAIHLDQRFGAAQLALAQAYAASGNNRAAFPAYVRAADLLPDNLELQVEAGRLLVNGGFFEEAKTRIRPVLQREPKNIGALLVMGNALAGLKSLDDATDLLERAVKVDPERAGVYTNLGVLQLAKGDRENAEATFARAVEAAPNLPDVYVNLGNFYRAVRRMPEAEQALKHAYALAPKSVRVNDAVASLYVEWNRPAEAERYLKAIVELTHTPPAQFALADFYVAVGRFPDAQATLEALAQDKTQYAAAKTKIALLDYATGSRQDAHKAIDEVLAREKNNAAAMTVKARLLLADERPLAALEQIKFAVGTDPRSADAQLTLARIQLALHNNDAALKAFDDTLRLDPTSFAAQLELADLHRARNELDTSLQFAETALKAHPESVPAKLALIRTLMIREDDQKRAESAVQNLIAEHPNSAPAQSALGALWLAKNEQAAARRSFERALQLDSTSLEALSGLTALDLAHKDAKNARARIETVLAKYPNAAGPLLLSAKIYALTGDGAKMESALTRALKVDPSNPEIYGLLGQMYVSERRLPEATKQFTEIVRINPTSVPATMMLGLLAYVQKDWAGAESWWKRTLAIDPRAAAAANDLAWLYADRGDNLDVALQLAYTAKGQYPDLPEVNDTLGWVYFKKKLPQQAVAYLEQSVKKDPTNALYHFHLGMIYAQQGEDAKARRSLTRALELNKDLDGADEARRTLKTLVF
jgi:tetratricopeptide (TPR) repeat protein